MSRFLARGAAAALLALCVGGLAHAKPATKPVAKPVNEATRLEADKLIAATAAPDLFLNETRDGAILIRHKASNFQCLFTPGEANSLMVPAEAPRGAEIGCDGPAMLFHTTYFIERVDAGETLDKRFAEALDAVKTRWPNALKIKVVGDTNQDVLTKLAASAPPSRTGWYVAMNDNGSAFTRVSVARVGDWLVTMRAAGPLESQKSAESLTEMLWLTRLMVMTDPALGPKPIVAAQGGQKKR
ncbi:MAG TPA: hypothetical protein VD906_05345 [Caulobacteraceae bacterium]|nr:hypothetical protein [Caulobacteraceae bacterium]